MVSLWGKNNDNGNREDQQDHEDEQPVTRQQQEADERTRLLPRDNQAYLSPDDPAVSIIPDNNVVRRVSTDLLIGLPIQHLGHTSPTRIISLIPRHQLRLVDIPSRFSLRQSASVAYPWLRLLPVCLYHVDHRIPRYRIAILLHSIEANDNLGSHYLSLPPRRHVHHPWSPRSPC